MPTGRRGWYRVVSARRATKREVLRSGRGRKALARRLRHEGRTGIIYGSVRNRPDGVCVAIFLEGVEAELSVDSAAEEWARFTERRGQAS